MPKVSKGSKGFTLIEVIAVLLLVAILSVVIYSRGSSSQEAEVNAKAEALKGHIRFVQMRTMNSDPAAGCNSAFGMASDGTRYFMFKNCNTATKVSLPGADSVAGIKLPTYGANSISTFSFDKWGRPYASDNGPGASWTGTSATINLTIGGKTVTITKNTGFVP